MIVGILCHRCEFGLDENDSCNTHLVNTSIRCPTISNVDFPVDDFTFIENEIKAIDNERRNLCRRDK
jgi:hypothetical protein